MVNNAFEGNFVFVIVLCRGYHSFKRNFHYEVLMIMGSNKSKEGNIANMATNLVTKTILIFGKKSDAIFQLI